MGFIVDQILQDFMALRLWGEHAKWLWEGKQATIVLGRAYEGYTNRALYLADVNNCYGVIRLLPPNQITMDDFKKREQYHLIPEEEAQKMWGNKQILFEYPFTWITKFSNPFLINKGNKLFGSITFEQMSETIENIKDIHSYDPSKQTNAQLADDWRIVCAWYSTFKSGSKDIKYTKETIVGLAKAIYKEIMKRVKEGVMKHEFKPDKMSPVANELYLLVSKKSSLSNEDELAEMLDKTRQAIIIKNFVNLVGSFVEGKPDYHDIDVLIRKGDTFEDFIMRAVRTRIAKMYPERENLFHFIEGDAEGAHDTFVPLFDLVLVPSKPFTRISMSKISLSSTPVSPFFPMKPAKRF